MRTDVSYGPADREQPDGRGGRPRRYLPHGRPLDEKAHYLENMKDVEKGAGLWNTALPVAHDMSFHDDKRCKTFTEIIVNQGATPYVIGTRLYLHQGKIIRVDSIVTRPGDWLFNANAYLKYSKAEDWSELFKYQKTEPKEMIRGANACWTQPVRSATRIRRSPSAPWMPGFIASSALGRGFGANAMRGRRRFGNARKKGRARRAPFTAARNRAGRVRTRASRARSNRSARGRR